MPYDSTARLSDPTRDLRRWVFAGGAALAVTAGYVNVVSLGAFSVPVSHMTGAVSRLSTDVVTGNRTDLFLILSIIGGFAFGAAAAGAVIGDGQLQPGRRYGVTLVLEALALGCASTMLQAGYRGGVAAAAIACGLQNGMASSYYGLIIRTTHVTGIVTDLGVILGQWLRGRRVEVWKPLLLIGLLFGFFAGGLAGQLMFLWRGVGALLPAAVACLAAGIGYYVWRMQTESAIAD